MKNKKLTLTAIILAAAVVLMAIFGIVTNIAKKPVIAQQDFPFTITYEYNGETIVIDDVYHAYFTGNAGYINVSGRNYDGYIDALGEGGGASYILRDDAEGSLYLHTNFHADYLMGDPEYDYFSFEPFAPIILYYDSEYNEYTDEQTLAEQGIRLMDWEYPQPIENSFRFSHITHMSGDVVIPFALIALVALIAVILFVKKDSSYIKRKIDIASVIFNVIILFTALPVSTLYGIFSDIAGSSPELYHQLGYIMPALIVLSVAASVALRRKNFHKAGFAVQFVGTGAYVLLMAILLILGESL